MTEENYDVEAELHLCFLNSGICVVVFWQLAVSCLLLDMDTNNICFDPK